MPPDPNNPTTDIRTSTNYSSIRPLDNSSTYKENQYEEH